MGYTTDFSGEINVYPPLNQDEIDFLNKFSETRRMDRGNGPYFVDGTGYAGQGNDPDIRNYNQPPAGQPGLWCQWVPTENGSAIKWNGAEKFYDSAEWMVYLIQHFLGPDAIAKKSGDPQFTNFQAHVLSGIINAQGEDPSDTWDLIVRNNDVSTETLEREKMEAPSPEACQAYLNSFAPVTEPDHHEMESEEAPITDAIEPSQLTECGTSESALIPSTLSLETPADESTANENLAVKYYSEHQVPALLEKLEALLFKAKPFTVSPCELGDGDNGFALTYPKKAKKAKKAKKTKD